MHLTKLIGSVTIFGLIGGCLATPPGEPEAVPPDGPDAEALIRGTVSGSLPVTGPEACQPLPFPITVFQSGVFGPAQLVEQTESPTADNRCQHEQVLEAPADVWARFGYQALCLGGGDTRLCGTQATRLCSVDLLMQWAESDRTVTVRDEIFGFTYAVPPQNEASRRALERRALQEVQTLLDETETVMTELRAGDRDCPEEDEGDIDAIHVEAMDTYQQLSDALSSDD